MKPHYDYELNARDRELLAECNRQLSASAEDRIALGWRQEPPVDGHCHRCVKPRPIAFSYGTLLCAACMQAVRSGR